jgi:hypothetical protein
MQADAGLIVVQSAVRLSAMVTIRDAMDGEKVELDLSTRGL